MIVKPRRKCVVPDILIPSERRSIHFAERTVDVIPQVFFGALVLSSMDAHKCAIHNNTNNQHT